MKSKDGFDALEQIEIALAGVGGEHELYVLRRCLNRLKAIEGFGPTVDLYKKKIKIDLDKTVYDGLMWRGVTIGANEAFKQIQDCFEGQTITFRREKI